MPYVSLNARYGTWYRSDEPGTVKYNKTSYLALRSSGPVMHSYVYFSSPFNIPGAIVSEAKLYLYMQAGTTNPGSRTISVQRVARGLDFTRVTYNNRPTQFVGATSNVQTTGPLSANHQFEIDVTADLQNVANGGTFYGYIVTTTAPFVIQLHGARTSRPPSLFVRYSYPPTPPAGLSPAMGRVVGVTKPTLGFSYYDTAGEEKITGLRVQTAASSAGFGSPAWDSGQVSTTTTGLDLSTTTFPARSSGQVTWWRVQVRSSAGAWSGWSTPTSFKYVPYQTVTITNPTGATFSDPTPPITWTSTGVQKQWAASLSMVRDGVRTLIARSGRRVGAEQSWTPPVGATKVGINHRIYVDVFDDQDRESTPGDLGYANAARDIVFNPDGTVTPPSALAARSGYPRPEVTLSWSRPNLPDAWNIYMDGRYIRTVTGVSTRVGSTSDHTISLRSPGGVHEWTVRSVVNGKISAAATATADAGVLGTWLFDDDGKSVCIQDDREHPMKYGEVSAVHEPLGSDRVAVITQALRGLEGSLSGLLTPLKGQQETSTTWRKNLLDFKSRAGETFTLLIEDMEIPVVLRNVNIVGDPKREKSWQASFEFYQQGSLPFDALGS